MPLKSRIQASEQPIDKVFSNEYSFEIPNYQRPYSWKTDQVGALIGDIDYFAFQDDDFDELKPYFLGSIVLIKGDDPSAKVVDGQQRLATLTILFSVLRELLPDLKAHITKRIYEEGDPLARTKNKFRLSVRERDRDFFNKYIQLDGGLANLTTEESLTDSQDNIRNNAIYLRQELQEKYNKDKLRRLAQYIVQKCYLVVVSTSDEESAYRIFSVLNDRGMQLSHADILKAEIIGEMPETEQEVYTKKWEDIEQNLGIDQFKDLFAHIRMIHRKVKAKDSILKEIRDNLNPKEKPKEFIDKELIPYAKAFDEIKNTSFESTSNAEKINSHLGWLNQIDNEDWIPPAISFLAKWGNRDAKKVKRFLKRLERLAFGLYVMRVNINGRIERYGQILSAIEKDDLEAVKSSLKLEKSEKQSIRDALSGNVYGMQFTKYLLLRLDADLSEGEARYNYPIISIEHVLPQNPDGDSEWIELFPDEEEREKLTQCLGNLVLLSRRKNSKAQNYEFERKKSSYFVRDGVSPFALTTDVLNHDQWTPEVIRKRQNDLLERCKNIWKLGDDD